MDFDTYSYDEDLAENGRKIYLYDASYLIICRWANKKFVQFFNQLTKPYGNTMGFGKFDATGSMPEEKQADIMREVVAKAILVGWGGMTDEGKPLEYSVSNAVMILKKHPNFMRDVMVQAQDDQTFKINAMDAELKNSKNSSGVKSE